MVELKQLKKFAVTPEGRSQVFSIKDCAVMIKVLTWLRNQLYLMVQFKWDFLEKGMSWISLFIALAPMLGFLGTVIGMIDAFDKIQAAGDMSPALVAGGIKVALITTVGGLIVAMILQVFYNYCVSKVEGIVNNMEDASVSMLDILVKYEQKNK